MRVLSSAVVLYHQFVESKAWHSLWCLGFSNEVPLANDSTAIKDFTWWDKMSTWGSLIVFSDSIWIPFIYICMYVCILGSFYSDSFPYVLSCPLASAVSFHILLLPPLSSPSLPSLSPFSLPLKSPLPLQNNTFYFPFLRRSSPPSSSLLHIEPLRSHRL